MSNRTRVRVELFLLVSLDGIPVEFDAESGLIGDGYGAVLGVLTDDEVVPPLDFAGMVLEAVEVRDRRTDVCAVATVATGLPMLWGTSVW